MAPSWLRFSHKYVKFSRDFTQCFSFKNCVPFVLKILFQISDDTGERFTFDEIRMRTIRAAQNLQRRGIDKRMIGIMAGNVADLAPIVFASLCLGCPINPIHMTSKQDIIRVLKLTEASLIFCEVKVYDLLIECLNEAAINAKIFTFNGTTGDSEAVEHLFDETGSEEDFV